jgi:hypothetical protein
MSTVEDEMEFKVQRCVAVVTRGRFGMGGSLYGRFGPWRLKRCVDWRDLRLPAPNDVTNPGRALLPLGLCDKL